MDDVTLLACEKVMDLAGEHTGDVSADILGTSYTMGKLIARVYEGATDHSMKTRCLDLIDRMARYGAYGLDGFLAKYSRGPS